MHSRPIRPSVAASTLAAVALALAAETTFGYPLDAFPQTRIARLEAYRLAQLGRMGGRLLPPGALLPRDRIHLRLTDFPDFQLPPPDAGFTATVARLLGEDAPRYGVAVLDLTDPARPRLAAHNAGMRQNPGSVGKMVVALAWFQALADLYPDDLEARRRLLFYAPLVANAFIESDHHVVPFWEPGEPAVTKRPLRRGDRANLWTYLDWMCSSSSNAAASMLMSHLVLLRKFGMGYPVSAAVAGRFFEETSQPELQRLFLDAIQTPVTRNGLDLQKLRQGSFFTREGKRRVPGTSSHATSRELLRFMVRMEQGVLVDAFSSLEIKRLLYLTERRIRYASSPALKDAAVFFKSGSLYSCRPEPGFTCEKYHGNVRNYMNSVTAVESLDPDRPLHYIAVVMSNVLRKNSAVQHQTLATRIHRLVESFHPDPPAAGPRDPEVGGGAAGTGPSVTPRSASER